MRKEMEGVYLNSYGVNQYLEESPKYYNYNTSNLFGTPFATVDSPDECKKLKKEIDTLNKITKLPKSQLKSNQKTFFQISKNILRSLNLAGNVAGAGITITFVKSLPITAIIITIISVISYFLSMTINNKEFKIIEEDANEIRRELYNLKKKSKKVNFEVETSIKRLEDIMRRYNCELEPINV